MNRIGRSIVLALVACLILFPLLWIAISSFKPQGELFTYPPRLLPNQATIQNYSDSLKYGDWPLFFRNTCFVAAVRTVLMVVINTMAGYALSKFIFRGRDAIFYSMIATLMIPLQVIMVPIFLLLKNLGMLNTLWGIPSPLRPLRPGYSSPGSTC